MAKSRWARQFTESQHPSEYFVLMGKLEAMQIERDLWRNTARRTSEALRAMARRVITMRRVAMMQRWRAERAENGSPVSQPCRSCGRPIEPCPSFPQYKLMCLPHPKVPKR